MEQAQVNQKQAKIIQEQAEKIVHLEETVGQLLKTPNLHENTVPGFFYEKLMFCPFKCETGRQMS